MLTTRIALKRSSVSICHERQCLYFHCDIGLDTDQKFGFVDTTWEKQALEQIYTGVQWVEHLSSQSWQYRVFAPMACCAA